MPNNYPSFRPSNSLGGTFYSFAGRFGLEVIPGAPDTFQLIAGSKKTFGDAEYFVTPIDVTPGRFTIDLPYAISDLVSFNQEIHRIGTPGDNIPSVMLLLRAPRLTPDTQIDLQCVDFTGSPAFPDSSIEVHFNVSLTLSSN
jgi:hypothetical protein